VGLSALVAFVVRLVALLRPLRADEAGFTLVARAWAPSADSVYGPYFVDRPPSLIAVFGLSDHVAGPYGVRVLGAVAAAAVVVLAAWLAALLADRSACVPVAVLAAALVCTPLIDIVATKGELLSLPFLLGAIGLAVLASRRDSVRLALAAGLVAALPLGLKQNLAGALVFLGVLLLVSRPRLLAPAVLGALVVPAATVAWALVAGVHLDALWYAVFGFRADASEALGSGSDASRLRLLVLVGVVVGSGLAAALAAYLLRLRAHWRSDHALTAAVVSMVGFDVLSVASGGSFWTDYAFGLGPGAVVCTALLAPRPRLWLVRFAVVSGVLGLAGWGWWNLSGHQDLDEHDTGVAVGAVAQAGDTLVVFGGRPDVQLASGLASPYPYLWSLPMRALDPSYDELRGLLDGPRAPTWLVEWWPFRTWGAATGAALERDVEQHYVRIGAGCDGKPVWLLRGVARSAPAPECTGP
jgi:4-amino-4-deoxy-L-arabinose transferase-like glycosyltransferase